MKAKKTGWATVADGTCALEIPNAGCLVFAEKALVFVPNCTIKDGKLVGTKEVVSYISFTSGTPSGTASTATKTYEWVGDGGEKLDRALKAKSVTDALNQFIQKTWKITPTVKQLSALRDLVARCQ